jgi:predicted aldo/keto reductase-like oxidoreductase
METRIFGKLGVKVSIVAIGGCGIGYVEQEEADKFIKMAMDHEINMIDVAPTYGNAEIRLEPWIEKYREKFFLAEKTLKRTRNGAWRQLNRSLKRLGTKYFDLYQFHAVSSIEELHQILGENGAMEAFKEAKETGLIKHIGITAHHDVRVLKKALEQSDEFETILLPIYIAAEVYPNPVNDFKVVLELARDRNIGVTAIKSISKGRWLDKPNYKTWYDPLNEQGLIDQAVWFTLSQEGVTTYSLPCDVKLWPLVLDAAERYQKLNEERQKELIQIAKKSQYKPLFPE